MYYLSSRVEGVLTSREEETQDPWSGVRAFPPTPRPWDRRVFKHPQVNLRLSVSINVFRWIEGGGLYREGGGLHYHCCMGVGEW